MIALRTRTAAVAGTMALNLFVGYASLLPMVLFWSALQNSAGRAVLDAEDVPGAWFLSLVFLIPVTSGFVALNLLVRPQWNGSAARYWALALFLVFLPFALVVAGDAVWGPSAPSFYPPFS